MNKFSCALAVACAFATFCLCGCNIGTGGTGEMVVPREKLREIESVQPSDLGTEPSAPVSTLPSTRPTTAPVEQISLTIAQVRELALRNNLDLKVELFNPSIARESLNQEQARYEAVFTTDASFATHDSPTANTITSAQEGTQGNSTSITPGLRFPLRTGGVATIDVPMSRNENNAAAQLLNPSYDTALSGRFSQPLLRGGGVDVNAQSIRIAFYGYQRAQAQTKAQVIRVLADADRVYWRVFAAREDLKVRRAEYDLAVIQLDRARRMVNAGQVAEVEVVRAQSGVADRVEAIITAQNTLHLAQRELKRIINSPDISMESGTDVVPATDPRPVYLELDGPTLVQRAMDQRMELLEAELAIAQESANVRVAKHEMLPIVNLDYAFNQNGLGSTLGDSFETIDDNRFVEHRVGLNIEIPIGNEAARSHYRQALLNRLQALATREQRELQIRQEVLNAADRLATDWQRILAARQRVLLAQRLYEVEVRQFEQGLRTSTEVLDAQTKLASAKLSQVSALADYQIDQVDVAFATGTVLGASNVVWDPTPPPKN